MVDILNSNTRRTGIDTFDPSEIASDRAENERRILDLISSQYTVRIAWEVCVFFLLAEKGNVLKNVFVLFVVVFFIQIEIS